MQKACSIKIPPPTACSSSLSLVIMQTSFSHHTFLLWFSLFWIICWSDDGERSPQQKLERLKEKKHIPLHNPKLFLKNKASKPKKWIAAHNFGLCGTTTTSNTSGERNGNRGVIDKVVLHYM